jgi:RNA ligase
MAKLDISRLRQLEADRLINIQQHPEHPLLIFNYTQHCQYSAAWDEYTLMCRGLITSLDGDIVARPFPKFFNFHEHANPRLPTIDWRQGFTATEKMDGSLGILFQAGGQPYMATRGNFISKQAKEGMAIFRDKGYDRFSYDPAWTYLFEIIYPENRIIVDYGQSRDLILLDVVHNQGEHSLSYDSLTEMAGAIGCPVVGRIALESASEPAFYELIKNSAPNAEGIVVRFDDGLRVKVKYEEYIRLHKLLSGVNARHIWECLKDGKGLEDLLDDVPDEFYAWVESIIKEINAAFDKTITEAQSIFDGTRQRIGGANRKDYAAEFTQHGRLSSILFSMLDGRDPSAIIWSMIRPETSLPFLMEPGSRPRVTPS